MFRFIIPIILIVVSITGFFMFTRPLYQDISTLQAQVSSYNEALGNSKALENERDKLTTKYNSINPDDLAKVQKLLPDGVDNIRLILEIEKVALPFGMQLRDVKYDTLKASAATTPATGTVQGSAVDSSQTANQDYGSWNLQFSTQGTYNNFIDFIKALESNLRIVDISSISFSSSNTNPGLSPTSSASSSTPPLVQAYQYSFSIKTYWLKN